MTKKNTFASSYIKKTTYGIGNITSKKVGGVLLRNPKSKFASFNEDSTKINEITRTLLTEFPLREYCFKNQCVKMKNGTQQGINMLLRKPVHGQRTKTNANTTRKQQLAGSYFYFRIKKIEPKMLKKSIPTKKQPKKSKKKA
jgi:ribosomal protein S13